MLEDSECISIEPVQAILRSKPHESVTILQDGDNASLRKSLIHSKVTKHDLLLGARGGGKKKGNKGRERISEEPQTPPPRSRRRSPFFANPMLLVIHSSRSEDNVDTNNKLPQVQHLW